MKHILDDFLNMSQNMNELKINSKLDQIVFIEKDIKKIIDSVHNTKQFLSNLEKIKEVKMNEEFYISPQIDQRILKLKLRAQGQTEELEELLEVYKGIIELLNAKILRSV